MKDNTRTAIGYICIALCVIAWLGMLAWVGSPRDFTFNVEMDNNTKEAMQSIDYNAISETEKVCYAITHEVWGVWDTRENIVYNRTVDKGLDWEEVRCPHIFSKESELLK